MADLVGLLTWIAEQLWAQFSWIRAFGPLLNIVYAIAYTVFQFLLFGAIFVSLFYFFVMVFLLFFRKKPFEEKEFDSKKAPFVSIHIPTRNELAAITCAKNCLEFDYPKNKFEIIIGDDSNDGKISEKLSEFAAKNSGMVKLIKRESNIGFKPGNLNNMIDFSRGEIFVVFDSDFTPSKDFLKRIINPFIFDKTLSAVQARWKPVNAGNGLIAIFASSISYTFHYFIMPFMDRTCGTVTLCGSAEAVRKSDLIALGKWKSGSLTEDIEYSFRLFQQNKSILYLEKLECECEVPFRQKDLYRQQMRWAYGVISSLKQHSVKTIFSDKIGFKRKFPLFISCIGYIFTSLVLGLFFIGLLALLFTPIAPTYAGTQAFLSATLMNVLLTAGPLIASIIVLFYVNKVENFFKLIVSSFVFGLITIYFVNVGIFKALTNKPMPWYQIAKQGNELKQE